MFTSLDYIISKLRGHRIHERFFIRWSAFIPDRESNMCLVLLMSGRLIYGHRDFLFPRILLQIELLCVMSLLS